MKSVLLSGACALALFACAPQNNNLEAELQAATAKAADLEAQVAFLTLTRREGDGATQTSYAAAPGAGPNDAKPGECYARVTQPAQFKTVSEKVVQREATTKLVVEPATYKKVKERVVVKEATKRVEVIPATYKTITEKVLVTPAKTKIITIPAKYKTVTERVLVRGAYTAWKPGGSVIAVGANALGGTILQNRTSSTGEVMCLVEVPAEYADVQKKVMVAPASTSEEITPAVYKDVQKRVIATPETTRVIEVPAEYKSVTKTIVDRPTTVKREEVPAVIKNVDREVEVAQARTLWTQVLCEVNTTNEVVIRLQSALKSTGHYFGKIDGIIGPGTRRAIMSYQKAQGVESDILTIESAKALGVI